MGMLAARCDFVIGVDTHRDSHTLVICDHLGAVRHEGCIRADGAGYREALVLAGRHAEGVRVWAIEGAGAYGAGLAWALAQSGECMVEVERPGRPPRRAGARSDGIDALRAARQALVATRPAIPRSGLEREALRVLMATRHGAVHARTQALNQLAALIVTAPESLRARLDGYPARARLVRCASLRRDPRRGPAWQASCVCLRATARRAIALGEEADELEAQIAQKVEQIAPALLGQPGIGPICAAQILISWSHPGRLHGEAAFAALAGVAPIPASSGQRVRHRLNRGGDRQLNRALHAIARCRMAHDPATQAYMARRQAQGKSAREARRCLVRYIARAIYRQLEGPDGPLLSA